MTAAAAAAFDAVIVGAGPAGTAAAILLARGGWSVALVEKQRFPRRKVCGECMAATNLPLLQALGIGAAFDAAAGPELRSVALMHGARTAFAALPVVPGSAQPWGRALGREQLDTLLLAQARAAGATVFQPCAVQAIDGRAGDWQCRIRPIDGSPAAADGAAAGPADTAEGGAVLTLRAPVAIAAHGSWELLPADRAQRRRARSGGDLLAFKANFRGARLQPGLLPVLAFDGGYGGMVVADGGLLTLACCIRTDRLEAARQQAPAGRAGDVVEALLRRACAGVGAALEGAVRDGPWLAAGPIDPGVRLRADDGVLRIGNAAGEAHPIIGEGMSMALQSAWLLSARLLQVADRSLLADAAWQRRTAAAHAAQWRRHFSGRLAWAAAFAQVAMRPAPAALLMALARAWPGGLTHGARWSGKTDCAVAPDTLAQLAATVSSAPAGRPAPPRQPMCGFKEPEDVLR